MQQEVQIDLVEELIARGVIVGGRNAGGLGLNGVTQQMIDRTVPGMAHWAGSGPKGKMCGDCKFYVALEMGAGHSPRCEKYHQLMRKWGTKRLDTMTPSCKYFEQAEK